MSSAVVSSIGKIGHPLMGDSDYEPVSLGSQQVRIERLKQRNYLRGSASDWFAAIRSTLSVIRQECSIPDWDGRGAHAIGAEGIAIAERVATAMFELLPAGTPAPDVAPEGDGEICLSWRLDATRTFAISSGTHGKVNFAGQLGEEGERHGWKPIDISSPSALRSSLEEIANYVEKLFPAAFSRRAA
jgi:hypothetical protein